MKKPSNRIAEVRKLRGMTQHDLAEAVGAHWITISKLERGKMVLSYDWAMKIGKALNVNWPDLFVYEVQAWKLNTIGNIVKGGELALYEDEVPNVTMSLTVEVDVVSEKWVVVETDEFYPFLQSLDLIKLADVEEQHIPMFLGRLVVAHHTAGRPQFGILHRGATEGHYEVRPMHGAPRPEIQISTLHAVKIILPNPTFLEHPKRELVAPKQ